MESRKALTIAFFVLVLSIGYYSMGAAPVRSDSGYSYHGGTEWHTNVTEAQSIAANQDKPILVYFWTTWCTYCEDYNEQVYDTPAVRNQLDEFVLLAVNLDSSQSSHVGVAQQYNADYPPQHVVTTPNGTQVSKLPGYASKNDFLGYLEQAQQRYRR